MVFFQTLRNDDFLVKVWSRGGEDSVVAFLDVHLLPNPNCRIDRLRSPAEQERAQKDQGHLTFE